MILSRVIYVARLTILAGLIISLMGPQWPPFGDERYQFRARAGLRQYDFATWLVNAFWVKIEAQLAGNHIYMEESSRRELVIDFLDMLREIRRIERQIDAIYADPAIRDPEVATAELGADVDERRAVLEQVQPLAEAILQEQVATVLLDEGFDASGSVWPPVRMHMTPLPTILIVSPRDEIRQIYALPLEGGLLAPQRETLEDSIFDDLNRSAYVTNIGGLGVYPTMIIETTNLPFLVDVIAHEWAHNWFNQFPVGQNYAASPAMRTINESAANIIGTEVGEEVLRRYYPELLPPPIAASTATEASVEDPVATEPPPFDFRAEMQVTRIQVDALLAEGLVEEAEQYMEERRQVFVANGYNLRVLNQAYFAFHGAYADVAGAAGEDPVGPLVRQLYDDSDGLRDFMWRLAFVESYVDLQAEANRMID